MRNYCYQMRRRTGLCYVNGDDRIEVKVVLQSSQDSEVGSRTGLEIAVHIQKGRATEVDMQNPF